MEYQSCMNGRLGGSWDSLDICAKGNFYFFFQVQGWGTKEPTCKENLAFMDEHEQEKYFVIEHC